MTRQLDLGMIETLIRGKYGRFDVPCPMCGPERQSPTNRRRCVLRVWRLELGFATYHCARCGKRGHVRDDESKPQIDRPEFKRRLAAARADAAERERTSANERLAKALWLWKSRKPIAGSVAETYLRQARGYRGQIPPTLGSLPPRNDHGPAMIAAFGIACEPEPGLIEIADAEVRGVHITRLAADGSGKAGTRADKIMIGSSAGFPIVLAPANDLLGVAITEGIEDGLSLFAASGLGIWVAGSASRMPALAETLPSYVEFVNIAEDDDEAGREHAQELAVRANKRGFPTRLVTLGAL
jgi:hypothetical protein